MTSWWEAAGAEPAGGRAQRGGDALVASVQAGGRSGRPSTASGVRKGHRLRLGFRDEWLMSALIRRAERFQALLVRLKEGWLIRHQVTALTKLSFGIAIFKDQKDNGEKTGQ